MKRHLLLVRPANARFVPEGCQEHGLKHSVVATAVILGGCSLVLPRASQAVCASLREGQLASPVPSRSKRTDQTGWRRLKALTPSASQGIPLFLISRHLDPVMYAIIETGGKQYRVAEGDLVTVEKLDADQGSTLDLPHVLMLAEGDSVQWASPIWTGAKVTAEVAAHGKHDKVRIVKFKRRKHHLKRQGHRQRFTQLKITGISNG